MVVVVVADDFRRLFTVEITVIPHILAFDVGVDSHEFALLTCA